ncbi:hypothetical protein [Anditalea andensis]|uniref:Uncharacterized protein n=1 Tax=Anditalea andensis TaxID=1048983 RepID=A0A074KZV9_9BACT|nr:hypothetical protein [Anditalea andensis]KEO73118.1 hypothetical protein EL17_16035 [Anditalea andensis]
MKKNILTLSCLALATLGFFSCSSDGQESMVSTINLNSNTQITSETSSPGVVSGANLLNATIRLREIGIVLTGNNATNRITIGDGSVKEISLLNFGLPTAPKDLGAAVINHNEYDRMTMRMDRGAQLTDNDPMKNRSLAVSGTVNGKIMHFYTNVEQIITRELSGGPYNINADQVLLLNVNLNALFNGVNLTTAIDENNDNIIEIEPDGIDGNSALHNRIVENLATAITITRQ